VKRISFVIATSFLVCGCESLMNLPSPAPPAGFSIAVLPLLGSNFNLLHVGFTAFENGRDSCPAAPLDPDDYVREQAKKVIQNAAPGVRYVDLECAAGRVCSSADFSNAYQSPNQAAPGSFQVSNIEAVLQNILAKTPVDRVLVITRQRTPGEANLSEHVDGVGIFHRSLLGMRPRGYVHASLRAVLLDGKTLAELSSTRKVAQQPLDLSLWQGSSCSDIAAEKQRPIVAALSSALDKELPLLLSHFGIGGGSSLASAAMDARFTNPS
jgi:hypothetical protein